MIGWVKLLVSLKAAFKQATQNSNIVYIEQLAFFFLSIQT